MKLTYRGFATIGVFAFLSGIQAFIGPVQAQNVDFPCFMIDSSGAVDDLSQTCQNNEERPSHPNMMESRISQDVHMIHGQASGHLVDRNFQAAIDSYTQVLQIQPDSAGAYLMRGMAYREIGNRQLAIEDFQQASQLFHEQENERMSSTAQSQLARLQRRK